MNNLRCLWSSLAEIWEESQRLTKGPNLNGQLTWFVYQSSSKRLEEEWDKLWIYSVIYVGQSVRSKQLFDFRMSDLLILNQ